MPNKPDQKSKQINAVLKQISAAQAGIKAGEVAPPKTETSNTTQARSTPGYLEMKDFFSKRINIIIFLGVPLVGIGSVAGAVYYQQHKTHEKPAKSEGKISQKKFTTPTLKIPPIKEESVSQVANQEPPPQQKMQESPRKQALREEILTTGSASISNPEDISNLADIIKELNAKESRN